MSSAGLDTLKSIPEGENTVAETLVEGMSYDNLEFRRVVGWEGGVRAYLPQEGMAPLTLRLEDDASHYAQGSTRQNLVLVDGGTKSRLARDVTDLTIVRDGTRFTLAWTEDSHGHEPQSFERTFLVRSR